MSSREVVMHLPAEEIGRRYRDCKDAWEKSSPQAVWLLSRPERPLGVGQVAEVLGLSKPWVGKVLRRWNAHGPQGLLDRRQANGPRGLLSEEQQAALYEALQGSPDDGGLWTAPKLARYVADRWGVEVCPQTAWRWLRRLGFRLLVPRPANPGAATDLQRRRWL
jgi:transposase